MLNTAKIVGLILSLCFALPAFSAEILHVRRVSVEEAAVRAVVTNFGKQLKMVPLAASSTLVSQAIAQYYAPYVAPELLTQWQGKPSSAPGKLTSSPWPDHIDMSSVAKNDDGTYTVTGDVAEMTSVEVAHGGVAGTDPISMKLQNRKGTWLITSYQGSAAE